MQIETSDWSGEGAFTHRVLEALGDLGGIALLRVEDAPATRSEADYNFISNEIYVSFEIRRRREPARVFGLLPITRSVPEKALDMAGLESALSRLEDIGAPDYADAGMIQYLRTERIVPPYQTRGYKLVELVRIYEVETGARR